MIAIIPLSLILMGIYGLLFLAIEAQSSFLYFSMLICVSIISICSFIGASNHFIISLDITYFLSLMMLIFYHTLKLSKPLL